MSMVTGQSENINMFVLNTKGFFKNVLLFDYENMSRVDMLKNFSYLYLLTFFTVHSRNQNHEYVILSCDRAAKCFYL